MSTGKKTSFACEFTIRFNVKDNVALDLFKSNKNISIYGLLRRQSLFFLKFTLKIQHILFNLYLPKFSPRFLVRV